MSLEMLLPIKALVLFENGSSQCNLITLGVVYSFFFFFWPHLKQHAQYPQPGIKLLPSAVEAQSLSH